MIIEQFCELFTGDSGYFYLMLRSLTVATVILAGQLAVSIPVGFLLGKFKFRMRMLIIMLYTVVLFLPYSATLLPNYLIISRLGLLNTQLSIILPAIFSPLGVIIIAIFTSTVPPETLDAALLETKSIIVILFRIVLPQIKPGIVLTAFISFIEAWNMVEQPQTMLEDRLRYPLSLLMNSIFGRGEVYNFAGVFLYILPPILLLYACRSEITDVLPQKSRTINRHTAAPVKMLLGMFIVSLCLTKTAELIYNNVTPKVYAIAPQRQKLDGVMYNCVVPLISINNESGTIYTAIPKETVIGTSYTVSEYTADIEYSNKENAAISWDLINGEKLIILAGERVLEPGENVIVIQISDDSQEISTLQIESQHDFERICELLDNLRIPYRIVENGKSSKIETRSDFAEIVLNICHQAGIYAKLFR